jgi:hypothetical protein
MADCVCLATCIFFNDKMAHMPGLADLYKRNYCRGDNSQCARYRVYKAKGRDKVPADLFPTETDRAETILAGA